MNGVNKIWRDARLKRHWDKENNDPGNSSEAQHQKYGSTEKCQERDPKQVQKLAD